MVVVIYSTIDKVTTAKKIAQTLVLEKLVACVNIILKIQSIYRWQDNIENNEEVLFIAKTTDKKVKKTIRRIKQLHSYEVPEVIALPIVGGLTEYLQYIEDETT